MCAAALARFSQIEAATIRATVTSTALILNALRLSPVVSDAQIHVAGVSIAIVPDCTPIFPMVLLAGAIGVFPIPARRKVLALATALPLLWVYNVARIIVLLFALVHFSRATFDLLHIFLWQSLTIAVVAGLFSVAISGWAKGPT